ncbi:MAG: hypothetical protein HYX86_04345 [Chloroflexi bacterium]|nr:hypothetical protein [Chloroflexota bacterium]
MLIILAYFQYHGALYEMFEGSVLFNLFFLDRGITLIASFSRAVDVVFTTYRTMLIPILIGFLQLGYIYKMRRSQYPSSQAMLAGDAFASLFLSFPAPLIWSVFDFQRNPDFFIFLPYAALGFGHFLDLAVLGLYRQKGGGFLSVGLALSLLLLAGAQGANKRESGLETQRQSVLEIERRFGPDIRVASIGAPQVMVLLHRVNPNRYLFIYNGVDRLIAANTQGGFEGWIRELETYSPDLVAFGPTRGFYIPLLLEWLEENYHQVEIGPWLFWVRNSDAT